MRALRGAALVAALVGGVGSLVVLIRAGQRQATPLLLLLLMAAWVVAPFLALAWAFAASKRWAGPRQTALYSVMLLVSLGSLLVYSTGWLRAAGKTAAPFVLTPGVSWLLIAIVLLSASVAAPRRS